MYDIGARVYIRSQKVCGRVSERNYLRTADGRHACYVIDCGGGVDYMTSSPDLRRADWRCDGCGRWHPGQPYRWLRDGEYERGMALCFPCVKQDERDYERLKKAGLL